MGILPVELTEEEIQILFDRVVRQDQYQVTVDLAQQVVMASDGEQFAFTLDPFRKDCMMRGVDGIGLTLQHESAISVYETRRKQEVPWLFQDLST